MIEVKNYKVTSQEQSNIGNLVVETALCGLYVHLAIQYNATELSALKTTNLKYEN
jgi:hypothetical protein